MHVLLLCDSYPPEVRSASQLTYDFASGLRDRGHAVTVVTPQPRYNLPEGPVGQDHPEVERRDGVRIVRVRTLALKKVSWVRRGVGELLMPFSFIRSALRAVPVPVDVIEVYSPPLPLALAAWWLKRAFRCPLIVNVQDLFPENAIDLGLVRNPFVVAGLRALERLTYAAADSITVHSEGNRAFLIRRRRQSEERVNVVPNWVQPSEFSGAGAATGRFRARYGLDGAFVMLFAGVVGPAQSLEAVIDAAWRIRDVPDVKVLIVGDGTEKQRLMERCASRGQVNVRFEHFVSKEEYPQLVADSDVGLVSITERYHTPVVPAKLLGYMAGGLPVLAALNRESDGHSILATSGAGVSVFSGDVDGIASAMLQLRSDPALRLSMGERGRRYAREHFDRDRCVQQYEELFNRILSTRQ